MYSYDFEKLQKHVADIIGQHVESHSWQWLEKGSLFANDDQAYTNFRITFSMAARKVPKGTVRIEGKQQQEIQTLLPGLHMEGWPVLQLCRAWLILQIDASNETTYVQKVEELFSNAEMNELTALYAALPLLAYPTRWRLRCAEGIRSNIGSVLDAIMLNNPYPAAYLDEKAWNQLILKAVFTDKDIQKIIGVKQRANLALAAALRDYAEERQSAHRAVSDQIWKLIEVNESPA